MPKLANERPPDEFIAALGISLPVRRGQALVLGSGAAGLRAAIELNLSNRRCSRLPERLRRHLGLLGIRQADASYGQRCGSRRRLSQYGGRPRRRRRNGPRYRLCRSRRFGAGAIVAAIPRVADTTGSTGRGVALSNRSRRSGPSNELRAADIALNGPSPHQGGDPTLHSDHQPHHRGMPSRRSRGARPRSRRFGDASETSHGQQSSRFSRVPLRFRGSRDWRARRRFGTAFIPGIASALWASLSRPASRQ